MSVIIETTLGDITVDLYIKERPRTCLNFLKLCKIKYYNFCLFHSVQRNFAAQTGDPTGLGRGGESIFQSLYGDQAKYFEAEVIPKIKHRSIGTVSMVNDGNGQHGSQFLITLGENLDYLDGVHSVFGEVVEGIDVLMKINETFCDKENRPFRDIRITHTVILDDPLDDPPGLLVPDRSPEPTDEQLKSLLRIGADEEIDDNKGLTEHEAAEKEEKIEAEHRAQVLEIIGDLPDKDVKPPDNVLFVCKLNPVTTDEDLEIIFSRFGTIVSCEIIRDFKSGDSLQYAFVEFSTPEECEKAYLKMDNVLIDDRRIHVDFSQSVSRMDYRRSNDPKLQTDKQDSKKTKGSPHREAKKQHRHDRDRNERKEKSRKSGHERHSRQQNYDSRVRDGQRREHGIRERSHDYRKYDERGLSGRSRKSGRHSSDSGEDRKDSRHVMKEKKTSSSSSHDRQKRENIDIRTKQRSDHDRNRSEKVYSDGSSESEEEKSRERQRQHRLSPHRKKSEQLKRRVDRDRNGSKKKRKKANTEDSSSDDEEISREKQRQHRHSPHRKKSSSSSSSSSSESSDEGNYSQFSRKSNGNRDHGYKHMKHSKDSQHKNKSIHKKSSHESKHRSSKKHVDSKRKRKNNDSDSISSDSSQNHKSYRPSESHSSKTKYRRH